jgi:nucleoside-diphosphate-sugar epimerase
MRIFVAGATGAVGRELIHVLISSGHQVAGSTRSPAKAETITRLGAEAVVADGLDADAMTRAVVSFKPDVVIDEMTDLSAATDWSHFDRAFAMTNRLRREGTDILLAAARKAGAQRFIAQSFGGWAISHDPGTVRTEADAADPNPPEQLRRTFDAIQYLERTVAASSKPQGIVLRYGSFYGDNTGMFSPAMVDQIRRRRVPLIGDGGGSWSFLHIEDAATATNAAIANGKAGSIYNIVDDKPAPVREWLPALAGMLGAKPPFHVPALLGRLLAGEHMVAIMTRVSGFSNEKAKRELGWQPARRSWRDGFAEIATRLPEARAAA